MFDKIKDIVSDVTGGNDLGELDLGGYEKYLEGITWPVSKDELVDAVQRNGGDQDVVNQVKSLGGDRFDGPQDILQGLLGGGDAPQGTDPNLDDVSKDDLKRTL